MTTVEASRSGHWVSVVIPTKNRSQHLARCLESLMRQTYTDFDVLVIDNGSGDDTASVTARYPVRTLIDPSAKLSCLFNLAWRSTEGEIVAFLNDDVVLNEDWLAHAVATLECVPDAGAVGGCTIDMQRRQIARFYDQARRNPLLAAMGWIYNSIVLEGKLFAIGWFSSESGGYGIGVYYPASLEHERAFPVELLTITAVATRRSAVESVGGFDEGYHFTHIDGDFFIRLREAGYCLIFNPRLVAHHFPNPAGLVRGAHELGQDYARFFLRNVRPQSASGWTRLFLNLVFINGFWIYKAARDRTLAPLGGASGMLAGVCHWYANR